MQHGARDRDLLLHACRQLVDAGARKLAYREFGDQLLDSCFDVRYLVELPEEGQHLFRCKTSVQTHVAGKKTDGCADLLRLLPDIESIQSRSPAGWLEHGGNDPQCGGLSRSIGTK